MIEVQLTLGREKKILYTWEWKAPRNKPAPRNVLDRGRRNAAA